MDTVLCNFFYDMMLMTMMVKMMMMMAVWEKMQTLLKSK